MVFIWYLHRRNNGGETNLQGAFLRTRNSRKKRRPSFILYFPCSDKIFAPQRLCVQLIMSCFRHLEKPIKTKEYKRKHFVFICFYWFFPVFLDGESKQLGVKSSLLPEFTEYNLLIIYFPEKKIYFSKEGIYFPLNLISARPIAVQMSSRRRTMRATKAALPDDIPKAVIDIMKPPSRPPN